MLSLLTSYFQVQVREAEFSNAVLRFPSVLSFDTAVSLADLEVNFTPDGRVLLASEDESITITQKKISTKAKVWNKLRRNDSSRWDGVVPDTNQKPGKDDPDADVGILDKIQDERMHAVVKITGIDENQVFVSAAAYSNMKMQLNPLLRRLLAPEQRQDFGYIFEADLFAHYAGTNRYSKLKMVVLHCGFLRLFDWPLQDHGSQTLASNHLIDIDLVSVMKEGSSRLSPAVAGDSFCVEVTFKPPPSKGWFWQQEVSKHHRLCGTHAKVTRLFWAISLQKLRFRDKEAEEENYGSHHAGKDPFFLKHGKVQRNLVEAGKLANAVGFSCSNSATGCFSLAQEALYGFLLLTPDKKMREMDTAFILLTASQFLPKQLQYLGMFGVLNAT